VGVWCVWCVVCGVWCVVCGVWCVVCGVWCVVCGVWCVVCGVWCVVCGVWCVMCEVCEACCNRTVHPATASSFIQINSFPLFPSASSSTPRGSCDLARAPPLSWRAGQNVTLCVQAKHEVASEAHRHHQQHKRRNHHHFAGSKDAIRQRSGTKVRVQSACRACALCAILTAGSFSSFSRLLLPLLCGGCCWRRGSAC